MYVLTLGTKICSLDDSGQTMLHVTSVSLNGIEKCDVSHECTALMFIRMATHTFRHSLSLIGINIKIQLLGDLIQTSFFDNMPLRVVYIINHPCRQVYCYAESSSCNNRCSNAPSGCCCVFQAIYLLRWQKQNPTSPNKLCH